MRFETWVALAALSACRHDVDDSDGDTDGEPTACADAAERVGHAVCAHRVDDAQAWAAISVGPVAQVLRTTKYLAPARGDARLPVLFVDANAYRLHYDVLAEAFVDVFAGLTPGQYLDLVQPADRELFAGSIEEYADGFGFTVLDDPGDPATTVDLAAATAAWQALSARFGLAELAFVPTSEAQRAAAAGWDAPFAIRGLEAVAYEGYTLAVGYGTVRRYDLDALEQATAEAAFGFQDVLLLDEAPADLERVVSGTVTGTRQAALSHLNVRSAARGTPNCYVADLDALAAWEGRLVRLECGASGVDVREASAEEAAAFWEALRPDPVEIVPADPAWTAFSPLLELPTATPDERATARARYGAKGANLAALYQRIDAELQLDGFVVPFAYYDGFVRGGTWTVDLGDGPATHTFAETLAAWHLDAAFLDDARTRRERLVALQAAMEAAPVDPLVVAAISDEIVAVWGTDTVGVRFRSSSNAEDALAFSGAGLYESGTACVADERDGDATGPSRCDPDQGRERTVSDALREVWASLWAPAAWEERAWWGVDQEAVAMGVLVNTRTKGERANLVAFTGVPTADDDRYLVNAQAGELDVVSSDPGVVPESALLTVEDGVVTDVLRVTPSSEVAPGEQVLDDATYGRVGAVLSELDATFPLDAEVPAGKARLWDTEWKVEADGRLVIKQIRPFLR